MTTDRAPAYPRVLDELLPGACHVTEQYRNNPIEADHSRLKSRLRPTRGLKRLRSAQVISARHALFKTFHRGHHELGTDVVDPRRRIPHAFTEPPPLFEPRTTAPHPAHHATMQQRHINALATEFGHGQVSLVTDALHGARRLADGAGRHGASATAG